MADNITVGTGSTFLTMIQPQISPPNKTIVYQFEPMSGGLKRLMRTDQGVGQIMIAEYISIDNNDTTATYDDVTRTLTLKVTATSGNVPVTRQYEATQRVPLPP
jgi:hypothetical protein